MKKITLLLLFGTISFFAQDKFSYGVDGLTDYVVVKVDSLNQKKLFDKTINWIKETYKNPKEVIKTTFEFNKIRIEGLEKGGICMHVSGARSCGDVIYQIEISFKDGKYKFNPISLGKISLTDGAYLYNKKGKVRKIFKYYSEDISKIFNSLNLSLKKSLIQISNDDW